MPEIAEQYIEGLRAAYAAHGKKEEWDTFERLAQGASEKDLAALRDVFPQTPQSLITLLSHVDGTYWKKYKEEDRSFYFLGSDVGEFPYYFLSARQMAGDHDAGYENYAAHVDRILKNVSVDARIISNAEQMRWLHFADCMNHGSLSQLFIDFTPSEKGTVGQVVRFIHDPDELSVIAGSFDAYLKQLINDGYNFIFDD